MIPSRLPTSERASYLMTRMSFAFPVGIRSELESNARPGTRPFPVPHRPKV